MVAALVFAAALPAAATNFQMHYNAPWYLKWLHGDQLTAWYRFTEDGQWLTTSKPVVLPYCKWVNIPFPTDANDAHGGGWLVDEKYCDNVDRTEAARGAIGEFTLIAGMDMGEPLNFNEDYPGSDWIIEFPWLAVDVFAFEDGPPPRATPENLDDYLNSSLMSLVDGDYTYLGDPLYIGIDLSEWYGMGGANPAAGAAFEVAGGAHADLPGYLFSTLPLTFNADSGWMVDLGDGYAGYDPQVHGFTGKVVAFSELGNCVPEPATSCLLALGVAGILLRRTMLRH
jgi:hypothetical protein